MRRGPTTANGKNWETGLGGSDKHPLCPQGSAPYRSELPTFTRP